MIEAMQRLNGRIWSALENALAPRPEGSRVWRFLHHAPAPFLLMAGVFVGLIVGMASWFRRKSQEVDPLEDFSHVLEDSRLWSKIDRIQERTTLGRSGFLWGAATCTFQDSGAVNCPDSQWAFWETQCLPVENRSGKSADLFTLYQSVEGRQQIVDRLKQLGSNSYRFSVEWSHIEPVEGTFDFDQLQVYVDFCRYLRDQDIVPMVSLHHFSEPKWFHDLGSFEKEENITYFLRFAKKVFPSLVQEYRDRPLVEHFCTINEPAIEAYSRYILKAFSPGKLMNFKRGGTFLFNALKAHMEVYAALKEINPNVQIGIVHQYLKFIPTNFLFVPIARWLTHIANDVSILFFEEGIFRLKIPFSCNVEKKGFQPKTDFVGLQYYSRPVIGFKGSTSFHEPMTLMPIREDAEGIYEAIQEAHRAYRAPVIITESGISTDCDKQRHRYMERVLYSVSEAAKKIGHENVLGYYVWSFCENSEWNMGRNPQSFGVFQLDFEGALHMEPRAVLEPFTRVAKRQKV